MHQEDKRVKIELLQIKDQTIAVTKISHVTDGDLHDEYHRMMRKIEAIKDIVAYSTWMDMREANLDAHQNR